MKYLQYILIFIFLTLFISCGDDSCNQETDSLLSCTFSIEDATLKANSFEDSISIFSTAWIDTLNKWELAEDELFKFTLSPNDTITKVIITSKVTTETDTITFEHQNEIVFLSTECGFVINFNVDTVFSTNNLIDSISLIDTKITREGNGLIEIYYF